MTFTVDFTSADEIKDTDIWIANLISIRNNLIAPNHSTVTAFGNNHTSHIDPTIQTASNKLL